MKGRITNWSKTMLKREILHRMNALDTSSEEYSNNDLLNDYENLTKHNSRKIQSATTESQKRVKKINKDFHNTFNRGQKRLIRIGKLL